MAVHESARHSAGMLRQGCREVTDVRETPGARHPLVRTDPDTGRSALLLGRRPRAKVIGLEMAESEALFDQLWAHATEPRFTMVHRWQVADTLLVDFEFFVRKLPETGNVTLDGLRTHKFLAIAFQAATLQDRWVGVLAAPPIDSDQ